MRRDIDIITRRQYLKLTGSAAAPNPSRPRQMRYVGKQWALRGETALVRPHVTDFVLAQFDKLSLEHIGENGNPLCYGWHEFWAKDFEEITK